MLNTIFLYGLEIILVSMVSYFLYTVQNDVDHLSNSSNS